jgi:hypothetical protein
MGLGLHAQVTRKTMLSGAYAPGSVSRIMQSIGVGQTAGNSWFSSFRTGSHNLTSNEDKYILDNVVKIIKRTAGSKRKMAEILGPVVEQVHVHGRL